MTRWLNDDEQQAWRTYLFATLRLVDTLEHDLLERYGIPWTDYEIMVELSEGPERGMQMSELASRAIVSRSRLTYRIDRLVERGWVRRGSCPDDGRIVTARLTERGQAALHEAAAMHVEGVRTHLLDLIEPEDLEDLGRILAPVLGRLSPA